MDFAAWAKSKYVVEIPIKKSWVTEMYDITAHLVSKLLLFFGYSFACVECI